MKRIVFTLLLIITTIINVMSQNNHYIYKIVKRPNIDVVYLYANPKTYDLLDDIGKAKMVQNVANQYHAASIYVICAHDAELWLPSGDTMKKVDSWNKDSVKHLSGKTKKQDDQIRSLQHPWFFNISGALTTGDVFDLYYNGAITYNAYGRLGCYLLSGRWDLALSGIIGYTKPSKDEEGSYSYSAGLDTRVYILKGKTINPFAGVGVAYATSNGESSVTIPLSAGLSIPVAGRGCIDFCYQYNKVTKSAFVLGYTYMHK